MVWEKEIHFRRCFGFWRELENHAHTVEHKFFASKCDVGCRRKQTRRTHWHTRTQPAVNMAGCSWRKHWTELICRTPSHCRSSNDVFSNGLMQETNWCNYLAATCINICLCGNAKDSTEVIGVRVGENNNRHWQLLNMLIHEFESCACSVLARERINHDPTFCAANKRDI